MGSDLQSIQGQNTKSGKQEQAVSSMEKSKETEETVGRPLCVSVDIIPSDWYTWHRSLCGGIRYDLCL